MDRFGRVVTAGIAVLFGIAGLSYVLAGAAPPPGGPAAVVEFTPDGKLKQPVGYRKWVYVGTPLTPNDLNDGEAPFPEFHAVYMDPESFAHYEKTGEFRDGTVMVKELSRRRRQGGDQRQGLLHGRLHAAWRRRSRTRSASRTSPASGPTSASATSIRSRRRWRRTPPPRATRATRTAPRRTTSSASTTPSCVRRPRTRSEIGGRGGRIVRAALFPQTQEAYPMNTKSPAG